MEVGISIKGWSILIVEDSLDLQVQLQVLFQGLGYQVTIASGGNQALSLAQRTSFDVILSDIQMPDGTGIELLKAIRDKGNLTPVLIMTAGTDFSENEILSMGANGFFRKPLNIDRMTAVLEKIHVGRIQD